MEKNSSKRELKVPRRWLNIATRAEKAAKTDKTMMLPKHAESKWVGLLGMVDMAM